MGLNRSRLDRVVRGIRGASAVNILSVGATWPDVLGACGTDDVLGRAVEKVVRGRFAQVGSWLWEIGGDRFRLVGFKGGTTDCGEAWDRCWVLSGRGRWGQKLAGKWSQKKGTGLVRSGF
jgi:hypothetical protein